MKHASGIRHRWLLNNVSIMAILVVVVVSVAALAVSSVYYNMMRSGLEAKLKSTADFFENYVSASDESFYNSKAILLPDAPNVSCKAAFRPYVPEPSAPLPVFPDSDRVSSQDVFVCCVIPIPFAAIVPTL